MNWEKSIRKQIKSIINELDEQQRQKQLSEETEKNSINRLTKQVSEKSFQRLMSEALQEHDVDCHTEIRTLMA